MSQFEHHSNLLPWRDAGAEVTALDLCLYSILISLTFIPFHLNLLSLFHSTGGMAEGECRREC